MSEMPKGWTEATLGDSCLVIPGQSPPGETYNEDGIGLPFYQGKAEFGQLFPIPRKWCTEPTKIALPGDVLISVRAPVGPTNLASEECCIGRGLAALRPRHGVLTRFVLYQMRATARHLADIATGTTFSAVSSAQLREHAFLLAPAEEQSRIVAEIEKQLTRLDAATAALKRVQANLKRYRASVLKAACEGRLVPTEAELARKEGRGYEPADRLLERILRERRVRWEADTLAKMTASGKPPKDDRWKERYAKPAEPDSNFSFEIPEGWFIASMDQLTSRITSGSRDWSAYYGRGTGTFVMAQNVRPGSFDVSLRQLVDPPSDDPSASRSRIEKGDLLVTIVGANTGDVCLVPSEFEEHYVCQSVALMRPVVPFLGPYLELYMNSEEHGQRIYERYTYGAGRPHLSFEQLKATPVLVPPQAECNRIADVISCTLALISRQCSAIDGEFRRASALRNAILQSAFAGKLLAQDPSDEAASILLERIRAERASTNSGKRSQSSREEATCA